MVKPQFELGRGRVGKGGVVRDAGRAPRRAARRSPTRRAAPGSPCAGFALVRAAGAEGQPRDLHPLRAARWRVADVEAAIAAVEP